MARLVWPRRRSHSSMEMPPFSLRSLGFPWVCKISSMARAIESFEIGAAAEGDVLAIVDGLAVGQDVGSCAAAKEGTLFEQTYAPAGFSQRDAGCQSRQPAADHDHAFQGYSLPCGVRSAP